MTGEFLRQLLTTGSEIESLVVVHGWPKDTAFVGVTYDRDLDVFTLVCESPSFEEVTSVDDCPELKIMLRKER